MGFRNTDAIPGNYSALTPLLLYQFLTNLPEIVGFLESWILHTNVPRTLEHVAGHVQTFIRAGAVWETTHGLRTRGHTTVNIAANFVLLIT